MPADRETNGGRSSTGALLRHSAVQSLVPVAASAIAIVMLALYTDWLGKDEVGVSQVIDLFLALSIELLGVSALQGMVRFYFRHDEQRDRNAVVSSVLLACGGMAWLVCVPAMLFTGVLRPILLGAPPPDMTGELLLVTCGPALFGVDLLLGIPEPVVTASYLDDVLLLALLLVPFQMTTQAGYRYLMIHHRSGLLARIQIPKMLVELGLKVWFMAPFGLALGVRGMLLSVLVGEVVTSVLLGGWVLRSVGTRFDWAILRPILRYSYPLVLASLYHLLLQRSDVRLIELLLPRGEGFPTAGVYGIGYRIGYLGNALLLGPFIQVFLPWIYAVEDPEEQKREISRLTTYALVFIGAATIGLCAFAREAVLVLDQSEGKSFEPAYQVVALVALSYVFWTIYRAMAETSFYVARKTRVLAWFSFAALLLNVGLNLIWIPTLGAMGAALSTLLAYGLLALLGELGRYRLARSPLEYGRIAACLAILGVAASLSMLIDARLPEPGHFSGAALGLKGGVFALSVAALWWWVLRATERASFVATVRARLR